MTDGCRLCSTLVGLSVPFAFYAQNRLVPNYVAYKYLIFLLTNKQKPECQTIENSFRLFRRRVVTEFNTVIYLSREPLKIQRKEWKPSQVFDAKETRPNACDWNSLDPAYIWKRARSTQTHTMRQLHIAIYTTPHSHCCHTHTGVSLSCPIIYQHAIVTYVGKLSKRQTVEIH